MRPRRVLTALALGCTALQFPGTLALSTLALILWLSALAILDRKPLRRLWMPRFWAISFLFALSSGLLLGTKDLTLFGLAMSRQGLEAGILMIVRGAFLFGLASWVSMTLTAQELRRAAERVGTPRLGTALSVAFQLLPELQGRLREASGGLKGKGSHLGRMGRAYEAAVTLTCQTARLAEEIARAEGSSNHGKE